MLYLDLISKMTERSLFVSKKKNIPYQSNPGLYPNE